MRIKFALFIFFFKNDVNVQFTYKTYEDYFSGPKDDDIETLNLYFAITTYLANLIFSIGKTFS